MTYTSTFDFKSIPNKDKLSGIMQLSTTATSQSSSRGDALSSAYTLQGVQVAQSFVDAAQNEMFFNQALMQESCPFGNKDYVMKIRTKYLSDSSWETSSSEYASGSVISKTQINTPNGIQFTPTRENYMIQVTNEDIQTNKLDVARFCMDELKYAYINKIDNAARNAILGTVVASGGTSAISGTEMSNTENGIQTIFGGTSTDANNALNTGDTITTAIIDKAIRLMKSDAGYYWNSNTWTKSAVSKNAWLPTPNEPFVLYIAPEQAEKLFQDPAFENAAEYGGREVILNGEAKMYKGVHIVVTPKVPAFATTQKLIVQGNQMTFDVSGHVCALVKAKRCGAMVFRQNAEFKRWAMDEDDAVGIKLSMSYQAKALQSDAIVRIVVADE